LLLDFLILKKSLRREKKKRIPKFLKYVENAERGNHYFTSLRIRGVLAVESISAKYAGARRL